MPAFLTLSLTDCLINLLILSIIDLAGVLERRPMAYGLVSLSLSLFHLLRLSVLMTWELDLPRVGREGPGRLERNAAEMEVLDEIMEMRSLKRPGVLIAQR